MPSIVQLISNLQFDAESIRELDPNSMMEFAASSGIPITIDGEVESTAGAIEDAGNKDEFV